MNEDTQLPAPTFTRPATYNKVKRIDVEVITPEKSFPVTVLRLEKGGNSGWRLVMPEFRGYSMSANKPKKTLSVPYPLATAKKIATALIKEAGSLTRLEELREEVLPDWALKARNSVKQGALK